MGKSNKSFPNVPWMSVGFGKIFTIGTVTDATVSGSLVRFKAIGAVIFRLSSHPDSIIIMSDGETDYFFVPEDTQIIIVAGSLNLMW